MEKKYTIANMTAAIIPSQWGGKAALRPHVFGISGYVNGVKIFDNTVEVIGGTPPAGYTNVRDGLMDLNPGKLIIELPGAKKDMGTVNIRLTLPDGFSCPQGTS